MSKKNHVLNFIRQTRKENREYYENIEKKLELIEKYWIPTECKKKRY